MKALRIYFKVSSETPINNLKEIADKFKMVICKDENYKLFMTDNKKKANEEIWEKQSLLTVTDLTS